MSRLQIGVAFLLWVLVPAVSYCMEGSLEPSDPVFQMPGTQSIVRFTTSEGLGSGVYLGNGYFLTVLHNFGFDGPPKGLKALRLENGVASSVLSSKKYRILTVPGPLLIAADKRGALWLPDLAFVKITDKAELKKWGKVPAATIDFRSPKEERLYTAGYGKSRQRPGNNLQIGITSLGDRYYPQSLLTLYSATEEHSSATLASGDSGGPVFSVDEKGELKVVALNQSIVQFPGGGQVTQYTNLNHPFVRSWISNDRELAQNFPPPTKDLSDPRIAHLLQQMSPTESDKISTSFLKDLLRENYESSLGHRDRNGRLVEILKKHGYTEWLNERQIKEFIETILQLSYADFNSEAARSILAKKLEEFAK